MKPFFCMVNTMWLLFCPVKALLALDRNSTSAGATSMEPIFGDWWRGLIACSFLWTTCKPLLAGEFGGAAPTITAIRSSLWLSASCVRKLVYTSTIGSREASSIVWVTGWKTLLFCRFAFWISIGSRQTSSWRNSLRFLSCISELFLSFATSNAAMWRLIGSLCTLP